MEWPDEFSRTPSELREPYPHNFRVSRRRAFENVRDELRKMDAADVRIESSDGDDPGVLVRFRRDETAYVFPCDRWDNERDNAQAIAKYLAAKRALDRYGVKTVEDEFASNSGIPRRRG